MWRLSWDSWDNPRPCTGDVTEWETKLTLKADRDRRVRVSFIFSRFFQFSQLHFQRKEYLHAARSGRYLRGHQHQVAITDEDRAAEKTPEEHIQESWRGLIRYVYHSRPKVLEQMLTEPYPI